MDSYNYNNTFNELETLGNALQPWKGMNVLETDNIAWGGKKFFITGRAIVDMSSSIVGPLFKSISEGYGWGDADNTEKEMGNFTENYHNKLKQISDDLRYKRIPDEDIPKLEEKIIELNKIINLFNGNCNNLKTVYNGKQQLVSTIQNDLNDISKFILKYKELNLAALLNDVSVKILDDENIIYEREFLFNDLYLIDNIKPIEVLEKKNITIQFSEIKNLKDWKRIMDTCCTSIHSEEKLVERLKEIPINNLHDLKDLSEYANELDMSKECKIPILNILADLYKKFPIRNWDEWQDLLTFTEKYKITNWEILENKCSQLKIDDLIHCKKLIDFNNNSNGIEKSKKLLKQTTSNYLVNELKKIDLTTSYLTEEQMEKSPPNEFILLAEFISNQPQKVLNTNALYSIIVEMLAKKISDQKILPKELILFVEFSLNKRSLFNTTEYRTLLFPTIVKSLENKLSDQKIPPEEFIFLVEFIFEKQQFFKHNLFPIIVQSLENRITDQTTPTELILLVEFILRKQQVLNIDDKHTIFSVIVKSLENKINDLTNPKELILLVEFILKKQQVLNIDDKHTIFSVIVKSTVNRINELTTSLETEELISLANIIYSQQQILNLNDEHPIFSIIVKLLEEKLSDQKIPPQELILLVEFILKKQQVLNIDDKHTIFSVIVKSLENKINDLTSPIKELISLANIIYSQQQVLNIDDKHIIFSVIVKSIVNRINELTTSLETEELISLANIIYSQQQILNLNDENPIFSIIVKLLKEKLSDQKIPPQELILLVEFILKKQQVLSIDDKHTIFSIIVKLLKEKLSDQKIPPQELILLVEFILKKQQVLSIIDKHPLFSIIVKSLENKINDQKTPPQELILLVEFILKKQQVLNINDKHPLFSIIVKSLENIINDQKIPPQELISLANIIYSQKQVLNINDEHPLVKSLKEKCINNFGTFNKDQLFEIAKFLAQKDPSSYEYIMKNFKILDQEQVFQIMKIYAQQDGEGIMITCMRDSGIFKILDKGQLLEIVKLYIIKRSLPYNIIFYFNLDKDQIFQAMMFYAQHSTDIRRLSVFLEISETTNGYEQLKELFPFLPPPDEEQNLESFFNHQMKILFDYQTHNFVKNPFNNVLKNIMQISDPYSKQQNIIWLANTMVIFNYIKSFDQLDDEQITWLSEQDIFVSIADFGKPSLRFQLSLCAANLACNKEGREQVSALLQQSNIDKSIWKKLTCLLSGALMSQGVHQDILNFFRSETEKPSSIFDKKENSQALVEMLIHLVLDTQLSGNEKEQILRRIINEGKEKSTADKPLSTKELQAEYLNNIRSVIACIDFGEINQLKNSSKSLTEITKDIFKEKLHLGNVQNYLSEYMAIFGESRNPSAITTYAAKINSLNDQGAAICLGNYITSTLNKTFKEERYKIDNNPHLKQLNEFNPTLLENWKKGKSLKLSDLIPDETKTYEKTPKEWMQMKLITENHLDLENNELNYLKNYLISTNLEESNQIIENLSEAQEKQVGINKKKSELSLLTLASEIKTTYKKIEELNQKNISELQKKLKTKIINLNKQINKFENTESSFLIAVRDDLNNLNEGYKKQIQEETDKIKELIKSSQPEDRTLLKTKLDEKLKFYEKENVEKTISFLENISPNLKKSLEPDEEKLCKLRFQQLCIQWITQSEELKKLEESVKFGESKKIDLDVGLEKPRDINAEKSQKSTKINKKPLTLEESIKESIIGKKGQLKSCLEGIQNLLQSASFNSPEFLNAIKGKLDEMKEIKKLKECVIVMDTDDSIDLLLCGTDVSDSCQSVDGTADKNKGLLGYLMDGKTRLLAVKSSDKSSPILARSMLRLLWDGEKPVLFLEKFYSVGRVNPKYTQAIITMAQRKAETMSVPLVSLDGQGKNYDKKLMALGGPAPWEYSDGSGGNQANGIYEIEKARHLT